MRRYVLTVLAVLIVLIACSGAYYGAEPLRSGPQPGQVLPGPFHPVNANGAHAGKPHCLVCEHAFDPVVLVFTRESPTDPSPALRDLLKQLDQAVAEHRRQGLRAFAVFLSEDFANQERRLALVQTLEGLANSTLNLKNVVLAAASAQGPPQYDLSKDAGETVLVYREQKVVANFAFAKLTDKEVGAVLAAVQKMLPAGRRR